MTVEQAWNLTKFARKVPPIRNYKENVMPLSDKNDSWIGGYRYANAFSAKGRSWILISTSVQQEDGAWNSDLFNISIREATELETFLKFIEKQAKGERAPQQPQKAGDSAEEKLAKDIEMLNAEVPESEVREPNIPL